MMNQLTINPERERQRRFLLFLPLLVLPFLALAFWAFGGGKGYPAAKAVVQPGINRELPEAPAEKDAAGKLSLYDRAEKDSVRTGGSDPLRALAADTLSAAGRSGAAANEAAINERLARIRQQLAQPPAAPVTAVNPPERSAEVERLEKMMQVLKAKPEADPEMAQLSGMLDKIMAIQHPAAVKDQLPAELRAVRDSAFQAIPALIDGNQKVAPGAAVSLVLRDSVRLGGIYLPKGQKLSGLCSVTNQRLLLDIRTIRLGTSIIPVSLTVFSLDGMAGIPAPEAELGEAAGKGTASALGNMQFLSMDQSMATQAATAGISAATGLLSKKVKKIRVKLHGGVTVLLRNNERRP